MGKSTYDLREIRGPPCSGFPIPAFPRVVRAPAGCGGRLYFSAFAGASCSAAFFLPRFAAFFWPFSV